MHAMRALWENMHLTLEWSSASSVILEGFNFWRVRVSALSARMVPRVRKVKKSCSVRDTGGMVRHTNRIQSVTLRI